jgi:hypothetical protein
MAGRHRRGKITGMIITALSEIHDAELRQAEIECGGVDSQTDGARRFDGALAIIRETLCGSPPAPQETARQDMGSAGD